MTLSSLPKRGLSTDAAPLSPLYGELAKEYGLVFESDLIGRLLLKKAYKSDAVHFNQQGYRFMVEELHQLLDQKGAL